MTLDEFQAASSLSTDHAKRWYHNLSAALLEYDIASSTRAAAFIAQVGHESGGFRFTRELWGPTPTQRLYERPSSKARNLGNTEPGDGLRFRGRGLIQITGRANYKACGDALGIKLIDTPERLEEDVLAVRSAAWWWHAHGCNELADAGDFVALTRRINGGTNGLADRTQRWKIAKTALGIHS